MFALQSKHLHPLQVFAFITNTPTLSDMCLASMQIQTQKETESHVTARGESVGLPLGGMSTNETSIKL